MTIESQVDSPLVPTNTIKKVEFVELHVDAKKIGLWGLVVLGFFWTSGGMYGAEPIMQYGPPAHVFLTLVITVFIYLIPSALISTDISIAFPMDGGYVAWIDEACGKTIGLQNMYWTWINNIITAAIYPILAGHYIIAALEIDVDFTLFAELMVLGVILMRLFSFSGLEKFNLILTAMSLIPSVLFIAFALHRIEPKTWTQDSGVFNCSTDFSESSSSASSSSDDWSIGNGQCKVPVYWGSLMSYALWMWSGFFNIGTLAGEVDNPKRTFPYALAILIPIVFIQVVLPLALAISVDSNILNYEPGNYAKIAKAVAGEWLDVLVTFGAIICQVGLTNGASLISDESLQSFAVRHNAAFFEARARSNSALERWLFNHEFRIAPVFVFFNGALMAVFVWIPYDLLVSASMLTFNCTIVLFLASYVILKRRSPDKDWVYGRSWVGAIFFALPILIGSGAMAVFTLIDDYTVMGVPHVNLVAFSMVVGVGLILQTLAHIVRQKDPLGYVFKLRFLYRNRRANDCDEIDQETMALLLSKPRQESFA